LGRRRMESAGRTAWSRRHGTDQPESEDENRVADRKVESEGEQCQPCRDRDQRPDTGGKKNRRRERSQIEQYRQPFGEALGEIQQRIKQLLRKPGAMPLHPLDYRRGFKSQQRENGNPDCDTDQQGQPDRPHRPNRVRVILSGRKLEEEQVYGKERNHGGRVKQALDQDGRKGRGGFYSFAQAEDRRPDDFARAPDDEYRAEPHRRSREEVVQLCRSDGGKKGFPPQTARKQRQVDKQRRQQQRPYLGGSQMSADRVQIQTTDKPPGQSKTNRQNKNRFQIFAHKLKLTTRYCIEPASYNKLSYGARF